MSVHNVPQVDGLPITETLFEVVVVGAGVAGASATFHLAQAGVKDILVVDAGPAPGQGTSPRFSGSAVMTAAAAAPTIKMMVQLYATDSKTFISHHGQEGAARYLSLTREGLMLQKQLAKTIALQNPDEQLKELGSFYLGYKEDEQELLQEFKTLKSLGCGCEDDIQWYNREMLQKVAGCCPDFECGIFFPNDAVIDSSSYAKGLLEHVQSIGAASLLLNTKVVSVHEEDSLGCIRLKSGYTIQCKHVVMASGGLHLCQVPEIHGVLKPCYSYLVHVPVDDDDDCNNNNNNNHCEYSPNFFTWGFTHDWCFTKGKVRCSGEDHFSAYKDAKQRDRCGNLIRWTLQRYAGCPKNNNNKASCYDDIPQQYGIYSETPDFAPLVGCFINSKVICYLLGCNAWGQTVLSYSSSLVPGILGYTDLTGSQKDKMKLLSIRRFPFLQET